MLIKPAANALTSDAAPEQGAATLNPFAGIKGGHLSTEIPTSSFFKMAIIGKQKSGKSWMTATAPGPIHVFDFDDRAESLEGKRPDMLVKTYKDIDQKAPVAIVEMEVDLNLYKYNKSRGIPIPKTFVFDSMTYMKKYIENALMQQMGVNFYRDIKTTSTKIVRIPKGWDVVNGVRSYLEWVLSEFAELGNIICVFHEKLEKDAAASTPDKVSYTGQYTVDPQYLSSILSTFNEVFRIVVSGSAPDTRYEVYTKPSYEFNAASTMLLNQIELPNIELMLKKNAEARARLKA